MTGSSNAAIDKFMEMVANGMIRDFEEIPINEFTADELYELHVRGYIYAYTFRGKTVFKAVA